MGKYPSSDGVIIYTGSNDRVVHAAILATPIDPGNVTPAEPDAYHSNADGVFTIKDSEKPWTIEILHKNINPVTVKWEPDGKRRVFEVSQITINRKPGKRFFGALILTLILLLPVYLCLHYKVKNAGGPLSNLLVQKITESQHQFGDIQRIETDFIRQIDKAVKEKVFNADTTAGTGPDLVRAINNGNTDTVNAVLKLLKPSTDPVIKSRIDTLKMIGGNLESMQKSQMALLNVIDTSVVYLLRKDNYLMKADKEAIQAITPLIKKAMEKNDTLLVKKYTGDLLKSATIPPWPGFIPWRDEPWRYFEILLWAFAGVLVQKIITTGVYLWKDTFQNKGIWMHIAHLLVVPLLVLVTMMILSMLSFAFSGTTGNGVVIDIADPAITRAFSFILAVAPWGVWDFVRAQAARITSKREEG